MTDDLNDCKLSDTNCYRLNQDEDEQNVLCPKEGVNNKFYQVLKTSNKNLEENRKNCSLNDSSIEINCIDNNIGNYLASKFPFYFYKMKTGDEADDNQDNLIEKTNKNVETACKTKMHDVERCDSQNAWWNHPKIKENWRVFFAAFGLLIVGIALITMGIVVILIPEIDFQSYVFFIAGAICFIPGAYHVVYVLCAIKGRKGYDLYQLPLFT